MSKQTLVTSVRLAAQGVSRAEWPDQRRKVLGNGADSVAAVAVTSLCHALSPWGGTRLADILDLLLKLRCWNMRLPTLL